MSKVRVFFETEHVERKKQDGPPETFDGKIMFYIVIGLLAAMFVLVLFVHHVHM